MYGLERLAEITIYDGTCHEHIIHYPFIENVLTEKDLVLSMINTYFNLALHIPQQQSTKSRPQK